MLIMLIMLIIDSGLSDKRGIMPEFLSRRDHRRPSVDSRDLPGGMSVFRGRFPFDEESSRAGRERERYL